MSSGGRWVTIYLGRLERGQEVGRKAVGPPGTGKASRSGSIWPEAEEAAWGALARHLHVYLREQWLPERRHITGSHYTTLANSLAKRLTWGFCMAPKDLGWIDTSRAKPQVRGRGGVGAWFLSVWVTRRLIGALADRELGMGVL